MLKKSLAATLLVCAVPALASASWFLTTQTTNVGGKITFNTYSTDAQTVTGTSTAMVADGQNAYVTKSFTAPRAPSSELITFTPVSGYSLLKVVLTKQIDAGAQQTQVLYGRYYDDGTNSWGSANALTTVGNGSSTYSLNVQDNSTYNVTASFAAASVALTASIDSGSVSPASIGNIYYGYKLDPNGNGLTFTFSPKAGYQITGLTGVPAGASQLPTTLPAAANQRVTVKFPAGYVFGVTDAIDLSQGIKLAATAVNNTPTLNPIAAKSAVAGSTVTVTPTVNAAVGTPSYTFTYVSGPSNTAVLSTTAAGRTNQIIPGPGVTLTNTTDGSGNVNGFTFTAPTVAGQYKFLVQESVSGMTKLALVNVFANFAAVSNQCQFCHTANNIGDPTISATWAASQHSHDGVTCAKCHVGTDTGGHPGAYPYSANSCELCHSGAYGAPTQNFLQSAHWLSKIGTSTGNADVANIEGPNGPDVGGWSPDCVNSCHFKSIANKQEGCAACHNQHRPETGLPSDTANANAIFFAYSTLPTQGATTANTLDGASESLQNGYFRHDTGCFKCHHQGNGEGNAPNILDNDDFPTAPHFDTTSDNSGVAFMNAGNTCSNCHGHSTLAAGQYGGFNLYNAAGDAATSGYDVTPWTVSGHANVNSAAWAEGGANAPCVRCHTTQGFLNYSSFHVVKPISASKSVLGCNGCHTSPDMTYSPFGNLTSVNGVVGSIRKIAPYPATYTAGTASVSFQFPDAGPSNLCVPCHSGRISGAAVKKLSTTTPLSSFQNSHYAAAAGILYKSLGYEFDGQDYANPAYFKHDQIGLNHYKAEDGSDTGIVGPCASCHYMKGPGHTLHVFSRYTATSGPNAVLNGQVASVNSTLCANCHSGAYAMDANAANENINGFQAALGALQSLLQANGVYYSPSVYGYFFTDSGYGTKFTNWSFGAGNSANNMGAAFNLHVLTKEPGAYAHNRLYTKRLIFDSIDWLQNGGLTGSINVGAITNSTGFDATAAASYLGATRP